MVALGQLGGFAMHDYDPILFIEHNDTDATAMEKAFHELGINNPLVRTPDVLAALDYLHKPDIHKPRLIILDLNGLKKDGLKLLQTIKTDETVQFTPIIVLASDSPGENLSLCYELGSAGYFIKPDDYSQWIQIIDGIYQYWTLSATPAPQKVLNCD
jgi:DNA-binding response OmpR family regulator